MANLDLRVGALLSALLLLPLNAMIVESETISPDYHYGLMVGKGNPDLYIEAIDNTPADIVTSGYREALSLHYPSMLDRLRGLADAIGLGLDSILRARIHISES
jgi:hypothetical protein